MNYVIDTDIFIDHIRGFKPAEQIIKDLEEEKIKGLVSTVTVAELFSGKDCNEKQGLIAVEKLLNLVSKSEVSENLAKKTGELRRLYQLEIPDAIIAATAIENNMTLITRNAKDFNKIKELKVKIPY